MMHITLGRSFLCSHHPINIPPSISSTCAGILVFRPRAHAHGCICPYNAKTTKICNCSMLIWAGFAHRAAYRDLCPECRKSMLRAHVPYTSSTDAFSVICHWFWLATGKWLYAPPAIPRQQNTPSFCIVQVNARMCISPNCYSIKDSITLI